jgi:hypothetical protein
MKRQGKWTPSPNDAMAMAAIRWFANVIETYSIELYATSPKSYAHTEKILTNAVKKLGLQRTKLRLDLDLEDCPPGYKMCDGICKPACEPEAPEAQPKARRSTKR